MSVAFPKRNVSRGTPAAAMRERGSSFCRAEYDVGAVGNVSVVCVSCAHSIMAAINLREKLGRI